MNQCFCCFTLSTKGSKYRINVASWVCTQLPINFYFLWNISYDALHHITSPYLNKRPQIIVASKYCNLSLIRLCCRYLITTFQKALTYKRTSGVNQLSLLKKTELWFWHLLMVFFLFLFRHIITLSVSNWGLKTEWIFDELIVFDLSSLNKTKYSSFDFASWDQTRMFVEKTR